MTEQQLWLKLLRAPGLGPARIGQLLSRFGDPNGILTAGRSALGDAGVARVAIDYLLDARIGADAGDVAWLAEPDHHLIWRGHDHYPPLLNEVPGAPLTLFVAGDPRILSLPQIAIVGSRTPTHTGIDNALAFSEHLARCGLAITSGLAAGIDSAAHTGAINGGGLTIAVCGTGLDQVYPADRRRLSGEIEAQGALVSEFPPGTPPRRENFPQRNRIIAGLSAGTLVIEAAHRSGSLITAHRAIEYGREVFAIPGSIHNPLARGCHRLIREGAKLVESAQDILEELAPLLRLALTPEPPPVAAQVPAETLDSDYLKLLEGIGFESTSVDKMVERTGLTPHDVSSMLLILELRGFIGPSAEGGFSRTSKRLSE